MSLLSLEGINKNGININHHGYFATLTPTKWSRRQLGSRKLRSHGNVFISRAFSSLAVTWDLFCVFYLALPWVVWGGRRASRKESSRRDILNIQTEHVYMGEGGPTVREETRTRP